MQAIEECIKILERFQNDSVNAILGKIEQTATSKNLPFCKDALLEQVLQLKVVAMESKHEKASYFSAVFQSLKGKLLVSDDQFRRYLFVLLSDKEQEKVSDRMSKVDKAFENCARPERYGEPRGFGQRRPRRAQIDFIQCYACQGYGHYARNSIEFVIVGKRNKPRRPNAEGGLRTVNEESTCTHLEGNVKI